MSVTYFNLKRNAKPKNATKPQEVLVELDRIVEPGMSSYMTYIDIDNQEKSVTGGFTKTSEGTYVMYTTNVEQYDIYEEVAYTYKTVDSSFSYIDNNGKERMFNRLDTLEFNEETNTHTGEVGNIEYIETEVELIEK